MACLSPSDGTLGHAPTVYTYVSMELCRLHYRTPTPSEMQEFELSTDNKPDVASPL